MSTSAALYTSTTLTYARRWTIVWPCDLAVACDLEVSYLIREVHMLKKSRFRARPDLPGFVTRTHVRTRGDSPAKVRGSVELVASL
jgi:hypothetical protein